MRTMFFAISIFAIVNSGGSYAEASEVFAECGPMVGASTTWVDARNGSDVAPDGFKGQVFRISVRSTDGKGITVTRHGALPGPLDEAKMISGNVADGWTRVSYLAAYKSVDRSFTLFISKEEPSPRMFLAMTESQAEFGTNRPQVRAFMASCGPLGSRS